MKKASKRLSDLARELGRARWRGTSKKERVEKARELAKARWAKATQEDRELARQKLAEARKKRWPKGRKGIHGKKTRSW